MSAYPSRRSKRIDGGASYGSIAEEYEIGKKNVSGIKRNKDIKKFTSGMEKWEDIDMDIYPYSKYTDILATKYQFQYPYQYH